METLETKIGAQWERKDEQTYCRVRVIHLDSEYLFAEVIESNYRTIGDIIKLTKDFPEQTFYDKKVKFGWKLYWTEIN